MRTLHPGDLDANDGPADALLEQAALEPFKTLEWESLTPSERLARAWALRARLADPEDAHGRELFPVP